MVGVVVASVVAMIGSLFGCEKAVNAVMTTRPISAQFIGNCLRAAIHRGQNPGSDFKGITHQRPNG